MIILKEEIKKEFWDSTLYLEDCPKDMIEYLKGLLEMELSFIADELEKEWEDNLRELLKEAEEQDEFIKEHTGEL